MRVIFLGHACYLVEIDGVRILTDPWLTDPIFEGLVERDPPLGFSVADLPGVDAIALTHAHLDHFNAPTLAALSDKSLPVVHPPIRFTELDTHLRRLGFTNLHARRDFAPFELGSVSVIPTPARGSLDECAYLIAGREGRFWDGSDAPQPPELIDEIAQRSGSIDAGGFSHNSFDQPALLGMTSVKGADHGPTSAAASARRLGVRAAIAGASNMRWRGACGSVVTRKVIRRSRDDLRHRLQQDAPHVQYLDLQPGDAWCASGEIERGVVRGRAAAAVAHDYAPLFLDTGESWSAAGRPSTADAFERDLPTRTARAAEASLYLGQRVSIEVTGADAATYTVDFREPGSHPQRGDDGAAYALRLTDHDWKDLFERKLSWQILLVSDRLAVTRFRPGAPPDGLHFVYAMQAIFP